MDTTRQAIRPTAAERFLALRLALWNLLPGRLRRIVPENFIGFAILNLTTFGVDMVVLALLFRLARLPYPVATTLGYLTALVLAYFLNRWLNFRSHAPVGPQGARYVFVVLVNYFVLLQGVGSGLQALGVQFLVARLVAAVCEGLWTYIGMRWIVFRTDGRSDEATGPGTAPRSIGTVSAAPAPLEP